jgi:hypothetical protein
MKGNFGCKQCECSPEDNYCNCLCHENELAEEYMYNEYFKGEVDNEN